MSHGHGLVNEFKVAVFRHALSKCFRPAKRTALVNLPDRLSVLVAHIDNPNRNFIAFGVLVWLRTIKENSPPWFNGEGQAIAHVAQMGGERFAFIVALGGNF